jgi:hypothetical protein
MDRFEKIANRVALPVGQRMAVEERVGLERQFSVHGTLTIAVSVPPEWLDENSDGELLPQFKQQFDQLVTGKTRELMHQVPDSFQIELEPV